MDNRHHEPATRAEHPDTSRDAAESIHNPDLLRSRVHHVMVTHGSWLTHDELYTHFMRHAAVNDWDRATEQGVRSRVSELHKDGWVERDNPATVRNARGRKVHQWRAVTDPDVASRLRDRYWADREWEEVHAPQIKAEQAARERERNATRYATTQDHLDRLPIGSVLRTADEYPVVFEQEHVGQWRGINIAGLVPSEELDINETRPARILYIPEDADIDLTQFPTTPEG